MRAVVFPGQGAQARGMGRDLFDAYPELTRQASEILGYSIRELCLEDPLRRLGQTEYTQPALFVVGALAYRRWHEDHGDAVAFFAGHSLGEYGALHAAGAFDFETGLRLVARRGELMAQARGGGMAAVVGIDPARLGELLRDGGFGALTVANDNAPTQQVVSGESEAIAAVVEYLGARDVRCVRLNVSGAFHSPLMRAAQLAFGDYIRTFPLGDPAVPVVANATARPYPPGATADLLTRQITSPVRWAGSVRHLLDSGVDDFVELGGQVLGKLITQIRAAWRPTPGVAVSAPTAGLADPGTADRDVAPASGAAALGSAAFRRRQGLRDIARGLPDGAPYGVNVLANPTDPAAEGAMVQLLLRHRVRTIEASAFIEVSPALVRFRASGLRRGPDGSPVCDHRVVAKVSRPEGARAFLAPAPEPLLVALVAEGAITAEQAQLARRVPMSHAITVEADSGGHTDGGVASAMMPAMLRLRDQAQRRHRYAEPVCLGLAGGIGTPAAMAAAFVWYFSHTARLALEGATADRVNFQVHTGPALGSFNQWVKGTEHESWKHRHVDRIALMLLDGAAGHLDAMCHRWRVATGAAAAEGADPPGPPLQHPYDYIWALI